MRLIIHPAKAALTGRCRVPGDKSISHRLAMLSGMAEGESVITGYLDSADTRATLAAMAALGAGVEEGGGEIRVRGGRLSAPTAPLDLGNSGTGVRLLAGALAGHPDLYGSEVQLVGDDSLSRRPMARIVEPLRLMGADIDDRDGCLPLILRPRPLAGIDFLPRVASAQVKSAVLLAGLFAQGETVVIEPGPSRDHTERLLPAFGVEIQRDGAALRLRGGQILQAGRFDVPGDLSSAAFALGAGLLVPGSRVVLDGVGLNPTRDGVLRILAGMGGVVKVQPATMVGSEPVGSLTALHSDLIGLEIPPEWVPLAIDEFPIIMALAAVANGSTVISGAEELRVKESDRLAVMCRELGRLGVRVEETADGAVVHGGTVKGGTVDSHGDHRIAMSLAVLGLVADSEVAIDNAEWIQTSYPSFVDDLCALGAVMHWEESE